MTTVAEAKRIVELAEKVDDCEKALDWFKQNKPKGQYFHLTIPAQNVRFDVERAIGGVSKLEEAVENMIVELLKRRRDDYQEELRILMQ